MPEKEKNEFIFMNEQYKKKPFYKKRGFLKGISVGTLAVIFGATSGVVFSLTQAWAQKQFGEPEEPSQILVIQEESEKQEETEPQTEIVEKQEVEKKELEIADYKMLFSKLTDVADQVKPSMVTVLGQKNLPEKVNETLENQKKTFGLLIAQGRNEYYILTEQQTIQDADSIKVTFMGDKTVDAVLNKQDETTGLAVLLINKNSISPQIQRDIQFAEFGTELGIRQGEPIISLCSDAGEDQAMSVGMITNVSNTSVTDHQYRTLYTDILGTENSSGILLNLDGKITGIVLKKFLPYQERPVLTALASPDIQKLLNGLVNKSNMVYLGITGKEINEKISREFDMPQGIYVKSVEEDSPAMYANVLTSDIITSINGIKIKTMEEYLQQLEQCKPEQSIQLGIKRGVMDEYVDMEITMIAGQR